MLNLDSLKNELTPKDIIGILISIIPDLPYMETDFGLILPTICHNLDYSDGSMKLYYYDNTKLFRCYTQCDGTFDIYELLTKLMVLRGKNEQFENILKIITSYFKPTEALNLEDSEKYQSILDDYVVRKPNPVLKTYDPHILNMFYKAYPNEWLSEGITRTAMDRFNIRYSLISDQIIIPHYNIKSELIGIRGRNLNKDISSFVGKYIPARIEKTFYSHSLMYNLYGLNVAVAAVGRYKIAIIAEGEKSVLKAYGWYGEDSCVVAACGDKINKYQIDMLINCGATEIVVAFDRMQYDNKSSREYFGRLRDMCKKYKNYVNMSFIYDRDRQLGYKDSPFDMGQSYFEKLLKERVRL